MVVDETYANLAGRTIVTSLGHTLVGASIAMLCTPAKYDMRRRLVVILALILIASLPDWPIPGWGHQRLDISHSIIVNMALLLCLLVAAGGLTGNMLRQNIPLAVGIIIAWMSHFLLDTLYGDSSLHMLWPVSKVGVSLPVPWLKTMPHVPPPFDQSIMNILIFETVTFLPLMLIASVLRLRKRSQKRSNLWPESS